MSVLNIAKIQSEVQAFEDSKKEEIIKLLESIRVSNDYCKVICETPRIFTIQASTLLADKRFNLYPEYHDFDAQFDAIIDGVRSRNLLDAINFLKKIICEKRFKFKNFHGDLVFNDAVIAKLEEIFV